MGVIPSIVLAGVDHTSEILSTQADNLELYLLWTKELSAHLRHQLSDLRIIVHRGNRFYTLVSANESGKASQA